jgi:hypothetical protein
MPALAEGLPVSGNKKNYLCKAVHRQTLQTAMVYHRINLLGWLQTKLPHALLVGERPPPVPLNTCQRCAPGSRRAWGRETYIAPALASGAQQVGLGPPRPAG